MVNGTGSNNREEQIIQIQNGDMELRERFLKEHSNFVAATVSGVLGGRSVNRETDDEFSIGLIALNEALDSYNPSAGTSFLNFARQVITRRVIDSLRRQDRNSRLTNLSNLEVKSEYPSLAVPPAMEQIELSEEFRAFVKQLKEFGISMPDLVKKSPRHRDSKKLAIRIGRMLAEDPELLGHLKSKKSIPLKKLLLKAKVNPKTVERHRIYIIAVALILSSKLDTLKEYIYAVDEGGDRVEI